MNISSRIALASAALIFTGVQVATSTPAHAAPSPTHISSGDKEVAHLRVTYSERISSTGVYIEFNTNASYIIRPCTRAGQVSCAEVKSGAVRLEDGSRVTLARWAR